MTQYPQQPAYPQGYPQQPAPVAARTSVLAIIAFVSSLILCCPVTTLLGFLLGLGGLATTGKPNVKGRGFAVAAVLIGLLATIGWVAGPYMIFKATFGMADESINTFVTDYNNGNDKAIYDRCGDAMHSSTGYAEFHLNLEQARQTWGQAERINLWQMMTSGGFSAENKNNNLVISFPMKFSKVGAKKVKLMFVDQAGQLKMTQIVFEGLTKEKPTAIPTPGGSSEAN